jgi:hypothetical protein
MGGVDGGFDEIDKAWKEAPWGAVVFNNPETLHEGDSAVIELVLSLRKPIAELTKEVVEAGRREGARVQVTPIMEARLTGTDFEIEAISNERQAVTASEDTRWSWEIRPTTTGKLRLHLTLTGLLVVDGQREPKTVTSFDRFLSVEVTWRDQLQGFVSDNWQWLWATLLAPIGLWLWRKRGALRGQT